MDFLRNILIVGNPNVGKTSLFNFLTNSSRSTGNWENVTLETHSKIINTKNIIGKKNTDNDLLLNIIDSPGIYDLSSNKSNEVNESNDYESGKSTKNKLFNEEIDLILFVIDGNNLCKSLLLLSSIKKITQNIIVIFNSSYHSKDLDISLIAKLLDTNVIEIKNFNKDLKKEIFKSINEFLLKLNNGDKKSIETNPDIAKLTEEEVERIQYICHQIVNTNPKKGKKQEEKQGKKRITDIFEKPYIGAPLFLITTIILLYISTQIGLGFQGIFEDTIHIVITYPIELLLLKISAPSIFIEIIINGIMLGVETIFAFIPLLFTLFSFITYIEESGYVGRFRIIIAPIARKIGLPIQAIIPMLISFGCNVPGILATKEIKNRFYKNITSFLIPFVPCGAKFIVFTMICCSFFYENSWKVISLLYFFSFTVMISFLYSIHKIKKTDCDKTHDATNHQDIIYRVPKINRIARIAYSKVSIFIRNTTKTVVIFCAAIKVLMLITPQLTTTENIEESIIAVLAKKINFITQNIGIEKDNWEATVALISGSVAKESVITTLNTLYSQQCLKCSYQDKKTEYLTSINDYLNKYFSINFEKNKEVEKKEDEDEEGLLLKKFKSDKSVIAYLIFILFYFPCISIYSGMKSQIGRPMALIITMFFSIFAYIISSIYYLFSASIFHNMGYMTTLFVFVILIALSIIACILLSSYVFQLFSRYYASMYRHR